jgi:acyl-CoA reductase-like NAD-dependent aldehyde dehydrogenase
MKTEKLPCYVGGRAEFPEASLDVTDKYTGDVAFRVALAGPDAIERAIAAAAHAAPTMAKLPPYERKAVLAHCARRFRERRDELAHVVTVEAGKPIRDARGEVQRLIETFDIAAEEAVRIGGDVLNLELSERSRGLRGFTKRVPVGPCAFITPFNFPLNLVAHKVAPAIAAGCTFVLKPSDRTPVSALLLAEVLSETALPEGAFSVLPCRVGDADTLVTDPRLAALSFTGSELGWELRARAGKKKVLLELGGNAACIVDADQGDNVTAVVDRLVFGAFYQSGQSCISVQRIYVHEGIYAAVRDELVSRVETLPTGDPKLEATFIGPVIDDAAAERLERWIASACARGARCLVGGTRSGRLVAPTLLENVPDDEPIAREEAFGPVALLAPFSSFDAAIRAANASRFGLQAGVFTSNLQHMLRAWDELEVGGVVVGDVPSLRVDSMPYGGVKSSGAGREGVRSAIEELTEVRVLVLRSAPG